MVRPLLDTLTYINNRAVGIRPVANIPSPGCAKRVRQSAELSEEVAAAWVGVARSTLARWEAGQTTPRPAAARRWRLFLAVCESIALEPDA